MPEFKLTMGKAKEYFGDSLTGAVSPLRVRDVQRNVVVICLIIVALLIFVSDHKIGELILLPILGSLFIWDSVTKSRSKYRTEVALKIRDLVNDPELVWYNNKKKKNIEGSGKIRWGRVAGYLDRTRLLVLSYLMKNGSSQGMHTVIKSFKNSNSANVALSRLSEKDLVVHNGNDWSYVGWKFRVIGESGKYLNLENVETVLNNAWIEMLKESL